MSIEILRQEDICLDQLVQRQEAGFSVMRSAHVGNARLYNQVLAQAGIEMLLVDHNVTGVDRNYMPESVVCGGMADRIADDNQLVLRTVVSRNGSTTYLDDEHTNSLQAAFPDTAITTNTAYIRNNESVAAEIIDICANEMPSLFKRKVGKGQTSSSLLFSVSDVGAKDVLQLSDDPRQDGGVLIPNEVDIVINFLIESLRSGQDVQYHISGPDMVVYMKEKAPTIQALVAAVSEQASFRGSLPATIKVELVPGTPLGIAGTLPSQPALEVLEQLLSEEQQESQVLTRKRKEFFSSEESKDSKKREIFLTQIKSVERELSQAIQIAVEECPYICDGNRDVPQVTQYDTLQEGGLFIPSFIGKMTIRELGSLNKRLSKMRGQP